jgi:hypothetical protein
MVLIYGEALSNADAARHLYMERFPDRQVPCAHTFVNAVLHLRVPITQRKYLFRNYTTNNTTPADRFTTGTTMQC